MGKIVADAKLAEQEMGISTLFLSFGFLEWYESDASDKKAFAPLLLLPVTVEVKKHYGKNVYSLSASEGTAEIKPEPSKAPRDQCSVSPQIARI